MENIDYSKFFLNLDNSADKTQSISLWLLKQNNHISVKKEVEDDDDKWDTEETYIEFYNSMFELLKYFVKAEYYHEASKGNDDDKQEKDTSFLTYQLQLQYSQVLRSGLLQLQEFKPGKVYDFAMVLANIFCEEEVPRISIEGDKKKKKKKLVVKKQYHYSELKSLCCVSLISLIEGFHNDLTSLFPLILIGLFRNLKKMYEKPKYFHANFSINLMKLFKAIIQRYKVSKEFQTKYVKYFRDFSKFPEEFQSLSIECSFVLFTNHKTLKNNLLIEELFKAIEADAYFATSSSATSKLICDVLFHYMNEDKINLEDCLSFYSKVFVNYPARKVKSGVFESLIQFLTLSYMRDKQLFHSDKYLHILDSLIKGIFQHPNIQQAKIDSITRYIDYFHNFNELLLVYVSDASKLLVLRTIFENRGYLRDNDENINETLLFLNFTQQLLLGLSEAMNIDETFIKVFRNTLIELSKSERFLIRIHASMVLKTFFKSYPQYLQDALQFALESLNSNFSMISHFSFATNHGHAMLISNMMSIADPNYVSNDLILKITVFTTSFLKKSSASIGTMNYYKELLCWIVLTGLMNYKNKSFIELQKNQLFLFWKNLLTHSITFNTEDELYKNLEIRNHSLTCLLAFLKNHASLLDTQVAKQVTYLLTKSTAFNNQVTIKSKTIDNSLLHNEHRILQIYAVIKEYVKLEFNSSILILVLKNFSDPNLFLNNQTNILTEFLNRDDTKTAASAPAFVSLRDLLSSKDSFAFGLTSLVSENHIDLIGKHEAEQIFQWKSYSYWDSKFEEDVYRPIIPVLSYDYMFLLYGTKYSANTLYVPSVIASLINYSMYIFSEIFPYLNPSIQLSVLENLNSFMFSKKSIPERLLAIAVNSSIAIHNSLKVTVENKLEMDTAVSSLMVDILKNVDIAGHEQLMKINAKSLGMLASLMDERDSKVLFDVSLKGVSTSTDAKDRGFQALIASSIYSYGSEIYECSFLVSAINGLILEKDPWLHTWALDALLTMLESYKTTDFKHFGDVVDTLSLIFLSDDYGYSSKFLSIVDYSSRFKSEEIILHILKALLDITSQETLLNIDEMTIQKFLVVLFSMSIDTDVDSKCVLLQIYAKLVSQNFQKIPSDAMTTLGLKIFNNSYYVTSSSFTTSLYFSDDVFNWTTSFTAIGGAVEYFVELYKSKGANNKDVEYYVLLLLSHYPKNASLLQLLSTFVDISWIDKLFSLYNMDQEQLESVINQNTEGHLAGLNVDFSGDERAVAKTGVSCQFKCLLLQTVLDLIRKEKDKISQYSSQLIELGIEASNSKVKKSKELGIQIVEVLLQQSGEFSNVQEAEITSTLVPAFDDFSSMSIVKLALKSSSKFLATYPKLSLDNDVAKLLVNALLELSNEHRDTLRIGGFVAKTQNSKNELQIHILSAWAVLQVEAKSDFTDKYLDALIPLWIISLRQNAIDRYGSEHYYHSEPLEESYFNMIQAIGTVAHKRFEVLDKFLNASDLETFAYVLYAECIEHTLRNMDDSVAVHVSLETVAKILECNVLCNLFFENSVHSEFIAIIERILLQSNANDSIICEICTYLAEGYLKQFIKEEQFLEKLDNLYELFRVQLKVITKYIPFIEEGASADNSQNLSDNDFHLIKKVYVKLVETSVKLPQEFQTDLVSCLLFTHATIFNHGSCNYYVPYILPAVKTIIHHADNDVLHTFYECTKNSIENNFTSQNYISAMTVFVTSGLKNIDVHVYDARLYTALNEHDAMSSSVLDSLLNSAYPLKTLILKNLIQNMFKGIPSSPDIALMTKDFMKIVKGFKSALSIKLGLMFLDTVSKEHPEIETSLYLSEMKNLSADKESLKTAISELPTDTRDRIHSLLKS